MTTTLRTSWTIPVAVLLAGAGFAPAFAAEDFVTTAVYSQKDKNYKRTKLADGSFAREYYVMSNAGPLPGSLQDNAQVKVPFSTIAGILARYLGKQGYFPAENEAKAGLVLVIHWGTTIPFNDASYEVAKAAVANSRSAMEGATKAWGEAGGNTSVAPKGGGDPWASTEEGAAQAMEADFENNMLMLMLENKNRERADERNARLLGYIREINERNGIQRWAGGGHYYDDLIADIEEMRYYVIVSAYDYRKTVKEKDPKLLWVTRVSIRSPGNSFADRLDDMVANASRFFGNDTERLVRQYGREGKVEIGESKVISVVSEQSMPGAPAAKEEKKP